MRPPSRPLCVFCVRILRVCQREVVGRIKSQRKAGAGCLFRKGSSPHLHRFRVLAISRPMNLTKAPAVLKHLHNVAGGKLQLLERTGTVTSVVLHNRSGATVYLQFFDQTAQPVDSAVPHRASVPVPAGAYYESDTERGFANGCWICISTGAATLTANGTSVDLDAGGIH
jgi:hypothetical protein